MTTTHNGRTFKLQANNAPIPYTDADLRDRGFDGSVWYGLSYPEGRQRKVLSGIFYRTTAGFFVAAYVA